VLYCLWPVSRSKADRDTRRDGTTECTVFDVEPFGHELKAEGLRRNEGFSVFPMAIGTVVKF